MLPAAPEAQENLGLGPVPVLGLAPRHLLLRLFSIVIYTIPPVRLHLQ